MLKGMLLAAYLAGATGDVATTCVAFHHGFTEANPIFGSDNCMKVAVIKGAGTFGAVYLVEKAIPTRRGKIIAYSILTAVNVVPIVVNLRTMHGRHSR